MFEISNSRSCESVIPRSSLQIEAAIKQMKKTSLFDENADDTQTPRNDGQVIPKSNSDGAVGGKMNESSDGQVGGKMREQSDGQIGGKIREISDGQVGGKMRKPVDEIDYGQVDGRKVGRSKNTDDLQVSGKIKKNYRNQNNDQISGSNTDEKGSSEAGHSMTDYGQVSGSSKQHPRLYSVGRSQDVNVRLQNDNQKSNIYDMCLLSDGKILMSDFGNNKLKLLDSNLNITHHCDLPYDPYGVCMINNTEAAVAMAGKYIQFVSIVD